VSRIIQAVADAALETADFYSEWAVRETGKGRPADKSIKKIVTAKQFKAANVADYVRFKVDTEKKMVCFPKPAGVVLTLIPVTNPVSTVVFKTLTGMITRNAVVLCPHPAAKDCSIDAADHFIRVAEAAGAPKNAIQVLRTPSVPLVNQLMSDERTNVILATGGPGMVRAAYSSSNPALGVGPGNVPVYVDRTADVAKAADRIVRSLGFDNGMPCTTESVAIADAPIADQLFEEMGRAGAYMITDAAEREKLRAYMYPGAKFNPDVIGKDASWIAAKAGFSVPESTLILGVQIDSIGKHEPFSKEKLCPVIGFIRVSNGEEGIKTALDMLNLMGAGHSAVIHANDPELIASYGAAVPVCRVSVNTGGVLGSSGNTTNLFASSVIGTGFFGRSSVDVNVGPDQLLQWTRVAYNKDPAEAFGDMESAAARVQERMDLKAASPTQVLNAVAASSDVSTSQDELKSLIREVLAEELRGMLRK
jgi:acetaldehyde dehydrogenase/alcohol dehydrogenase